VLDLRKLDDQSADEPFYIPPPIFPEFLSEEAQDLILRMMEPSLEKRISLSEAKKHAWLEKNL
jgi:serine/threonine protein kinase